MKRLVLVGGGHAHLSVLRAMARQRPPDVELVLITPQVYQNYSGMLPGWISGHYDQNQCRVDLHPLAQAGGAHLILDRVLGMDAARGCVFPANGRPIEYDLLSLDIGSEVDTSWLLTLGDKLLPVKPLDNFYSLWPGLLEQAGAKKDYRLVVVGAGAAGVETALATNHVFAHSSIDAQVDLVASESGLLPEHAKAVQRRVRRYAERAGVRLHFQRGAGTAGGVLLSDGTLLPADRVIAATGARPPVWLQMSGLWLDELGYIQVNQHHQSPSHTNVFAVGDVCARKDTNMSRSGVHAVRAGPVLAGNLIAALSGAPLQSYSPKARSLYLLACGPKYAIASWGRWSTEGAWVWHWKDRIDRRFIQRFRTEAAKDTLPATALQDQAQ